MTAAYSLLVNFKPPKGEETRQNPRNPDRAVEEEDGMTFVQAGEAIAGADGVTHTHVTCFRCEHKGHYANKCPHGPNATLLQAEAANAVTLLQASHTKALLPMMTTRAMRFRILPSPSCPRVTSSSHRPGCFSTASQLFRFLKTRISSLTSGAATVS